MYYLFQAAGFKEDFEQERRDREKLHADLTSQLTRSQGVTRDLQQKLIESIHDKEHKSQAIEVAHKEIEVLQNQISTLQEQKSTLEQVASKLTEEEDKVKNMEEEKLVLTSQVNNYSRQCEDLKQHFEEKVETLEEEKLVLTQQVKGYSRQCEELKKTMVQLQEKLKTLDEQVYHKERIAIEVHVMYVTKLNTVFNIYTNSDSPLYYLYFSSSLLSIKLY